MKAFRWPKNPIIAPNDVKPSREGFEVIGVFNAGVARCGGEVVLLVRVAERPIRAEPGVVPVGVYDASRGEIVIKEFSKNDPRNDFSDPRLIVRPSETYLTSISHLRVARSQDGIKFKVEDRPAISAANDLESFGVEDPRITPIKGIYYISYVAVCGLGVTTCLASTHDFKSFERHGAMFCPENKDVAVFGGRIGGKYYALHRPVSPLFKKQDIWIAESPDLICWGNHRRLMGPREGCWDEAKVGASAPPLRVEQGWVEIYHGSDRNNRYCLGAVLLDGDAPWKIMARAKDAILAPEADYELAGFFGNVVFSCGVLLEDEKLKIYYGASDSTVCYAEAAWEEVARRLGVC